MLRETRDGFPVCWAPDSANSFSSAFDLLAEHDQDWRLEPYRRRRQRLAALFAEVEPPLQLVPATDDHEQAVRWLEPSSALVGIEGVVVKARDQPYRAGHTGDWRKIRSVGARGRY